MKLTKETLKKIKGNVDLIAKLAVAAGKSYQTIDRWIKTNSEFLTTAACLSVICAELNVAQEDVLQKQKAA